LPYELFFIAKYKFLFNERYVFGPCLLTAQVLYLREVTPKSATEMCLQNVLPSTSRMWFQVAAKCARVPPECASYGKCYQQAHTEVEPYATGMCLQNVPPGTSRRASGSMACFLPLHTTDMFLTNKR